MTYLETIALHLATKHAIAAGIREPWIWATENAADFLDQAADPWIQAECERETDAMLAEYDAITELANMLLGPPPPADAPLDDHVAYALKLFDLLPPCGE